ERSLAMLAKKALASHADTRIREFVQVRPGISLFSGGLGDVIEDLGRSTPYVLVEDAVDIREVADLDHNDATFFLGDHLGLDDATRLQLAAIGGSPISVGPMSLHAEDVIAIVSNELDRRAQSH
ncbi:MAG: tRNA (pseudouridine(54)-N(1))-methyltransferase TrmY, partial [Myxococcota bacterium]|nr:tRNA (pseudouridine(54)-N(1))-methyltransferase TrmY [Myxococcota bacterium]